MQISSLVVRIGANITELQSGLAKASQSIEKVGKNMEQMGKTLTTRVTAPLTALGAVAVRAFGIQEKAELQLRAALQANGREVDKLFGSYNAFAQEMQRLTVVGDETTLAMLAQAESLGITGDSAQRAVKNSIAMQSAFGVNAQSALRYTAALEEGNATMLTRYIPALRDIKDDAERAAKAQEILANAFSSAEAEAQGSTGQMVQMKNAIGDLMEEFGEIISKAIMPMIKRIKELAERFQGLDTVTKEQIVVFGTILALMGPLVLGLGKITLAVRALTIAMMANPYLAIAAGLLAIGTHVFMVNRRLSRMNDLVEDALNLTPTGTRDEIDKVNEAIVFQEELLEKARKQRMFGNDTERRLAREKVTQLENELATLIRIRDESALLHHDSTRASNESEQANRNLAGSYDDLSEAVKGLNDQLSDNNSIIDDIVNSSEMITKAQVEEVRVLTEKNRQLEHQIYLNRLLLGLEKPKENVEKVDLTEQLRMVGIQDMLAGKMQLVNVENKKQPQAWRDVIDAIGEFSAMSEFAHNIAMNFTSSFGQGMANVVVQGEKLVDVLKNIGKLLLSSAIQFGIQAFLTGGLGSGAGFFGKGGGLMGKIFGKKAISMGDGLITSGGDIVKFHPNDSILAMKDFSKLNTGGSQRVEVYGTIKGQDLFISSQRGSTSFNR